MVKKKFSPKVYAVAEEAEIKSGSSSNSEDEYEDVNMVNFKYYTQRRLIVCIV